MLEPNRKRRRERGVALITAVIVILAYAGLTLSYFAVSTTTVGHAERRGTNLRMETTATSAAKLAAQETWNRYVAWNGGEAGDLDSFRDFLESGELDVVVAPGQAKASFGAAADVRHLVTSDGDHFGQLHLGGAELRRRDTASTTDLEYTVTVATGDVATARRATVRQAFTVGGEKFRGFEYALLSNNVNCIMCHATFDVADRFYNTDVAKLGTFDRVKIGTLEALQIRPDEAHSQVFGTIHSRGTLIDDLGNSMASLDGSTLFGVEMDGGKILEDDDGSVYDDDLTLAVGDPLPTNGQLYLDYPEEKAKMTDGELPTSFPSAIPDVDGDGQVDAAEFDLVAGDASGSLSGGTILTVADGSTFGGSFASGGLATGIDGSTSDHVVLVGTDADPIVINGKVAIDGDVVIFGTVKGEGAIYASGNVYIVGDLTYADGVDALGNQTYGVGADGSPNSLAIAAAGNIIAGDHLSIPGWGPYKDNPLPVTGDAGGSFNFTMNEIATFNRREWSMTQPMLPGIDGTLVPNPGYVPGYQPNYYTLDAGDPVMILNGADLPPDQQFKMYFDPVTGLWKGIDNLQQFDPEFVQQIQPGDPEYQAANIKSLSPTDGWMSTAELQQLRKYAEALHPVGPMQIDALLYTNSAAFAMLRNLSRYQGSLTLNGGLVAADTGVLMPNGLQVNFDSRPSEFVGLADLTKPVEMRRAVWQRVGENAGVTP